MEYADVKFVTVPGLPEGDAVVVSPERVAEVRRVMSERMDAMLRAALAAPMLPPSGPTVFVWPPKPQRFDPYGLVHIVNIA